MACGAKLGVAAALITSLAFTTQRFFSCLGNIIGGVLWK
jgi:hypothetical protein